MLEARGVEITPKTHQILRVLAPGLRRLGGVLAETVLNTNLRNNIKGRPGVYELHPHLLHVESLEENDTYKMVYFDNNGLLHYAQVPVSETSFDITDSTKPTVTFDDKGACKIIMPKGKKNQVISTPSWRLGGNVVKCKN